MKCSKCGKRFNSLPAMAKHYRKKHPAAMKRKVRRVDVVPRSIKERTGGKFCRHCGEFLG